MRRWTWVAVLVLGLLAAACSGGSDGGDSMAEESAVEADRGTAELAPEGEVGVGGAPAPVDESADADQEPSGGGAGVEDQAVPDDATAATGERIIKEGTVTIEVDERQFDVAYGQIIGRAQALGGHVVGSTSTMTDDGLVRGSVTVRVPVDAFEDLLTSLGDAGEIVDRTITSQDVTGEYTDLESRERHLRAQEAFYLELLAEAETIQDAIAVQQQLEALQGELERILGRLNLLEDRTAFSTLTVTIIEGEADAVAAADEDGPSLAGYWDTARDAFVNVVGALLVVVIATAPFAAIATVIGLVVWAVLRTRRHRAPVLPPPPAHQAPVPPAPEPEHDPADVG